MSTTQFHLARILFVLFISFNGLSQNPHPDLNKFYALFPTDKSRLVQSEYDRVKQLYETTLQYAKFIKLSGHTDSRGSNDYNIELSKRRVETIRRLLIQFGYDARKIQVEYAGESRPLNNNANDAEMRDNRRVTITWDFDRPQVAEMGDIRDLYKLLEQEKQEFCIDPQSPTVLRLAQGTIIQIPAKAFNTSSTSCITFRTKEIYKFSDMIMENLTTTSDGQLLETGGMIYTEALDANGQALSLNPGKSLTIMLPTSFPRDDMKLFYGDRDPHSQQMNWRLPENQFNDIIPFDLNADALLGGGPLSEFKDCREYELPAISDCEKCPMFFCRLFGRMDETFAGMGNKNLRDQNKEFRSCQKELRKRKSRNRAAEENEYCYTVFTQYNVSNWQELQDTLRKIEEARQQQIFSEYGVENMEQLRDTLRKIQEEKNREMFREYGVENMEQLRDTLAKIRIQNEEARIASGEASAGELNYFVARVTQTGWMNCDAFSKFPESKKIVMYTVLTRDRETDCNLMFKDRKAMMKSDYDGSKFKFSRIIANLGVWFIAIRYKGKQAYLSLTSGATRKDADALNEFKPVSIDELKAELRKLDE